MIHLFAYYDINSRFWFRSLKTVKRENIYFISFLISIYHYLHQIGFLPVSLPSSWVENGIKCGVCPLWQNLALCLAAMKMKRRYSSLLYFNEKLLCKMWWSKLKESMLLPSPFVFKLVSEQNITHHRQKKNCYTYLLTILTCVMLSTTVYRVYVYGINACLSTELNLGVAKTTYFIYSKVFKKKMLGLKCNCANVLAPSFALENIRHIFFRFEVRSSLHNS